MEVPVPKAVIPSRALRAILGGLLPSNVVEPPPRHVAVLGLEIQMGIRFALIETTLPGPDPGNETPPRFSGLEALEPEDGPEAGEPAEPRGAEVPPEERPQVGGLRGDRKVATGGRGQKNGGRVVWWR